MARELFCAKCNKSMGVARDARLRTGMVIYCGPCDKRTLGLLAMLEKKVEQAHEMPDFMAEVFGQNSGKRKR